ncbi:S-layer homology domain-containing protein [Heyndrickxia sp. FSL K6-6286]|uniref:S-layer homology domain-containing protein n=1 Tax=Heyndrickxia sp. FSL K6-6286 TaxID=2921510 RepID=UPI00315A3FD6
MFDTCGNLVNIQKADYKDVSAKYWVTEAKETNFMVVYNDNTFCPEEKLTRAEAVKVLNRLFQRGPLSGVDKPTLKDVPTRNWAFEEIEEAARDINTKLIKMEKN